MIEYLVDPYRSLAVLPTPECTAFKIGCVIKVASSTFPFICVFAMLCSSSLSAATTSFWSKFSSPVIVSKPKRGCVSPSRLSGERWGGGKKIMTNRRSRRPPVPPPTHVVQDRPFPAGHKAPTSTALSRSESPRPAEHSTAQIQPCGPASRIAGPDMSFAIAGEWTFCETRRKTRCGPALYYAK